MSELFLALFFMYFVLLSGITNRILGCDLQKKMRDSPIANHAILFFSVFFFTYIFEWYNFYGLGDVNKSWKMDKKHNIEEFRNISNLLKNDKVKYLSKAFIKSVLIYIIFILTTKIDGTSIWIFLIISAILIMVQVLLKSHNVNLYKYLNYNDIFFVRDSEKLKEKFPKEKNLDEFLMVYNGLGTVYIFIMLFLVYRSGVYYMKQRKDHKKNFSFMKFFLGTNKCKGKYI